MRKLLCASLWRNSAWAPPFAVALFAATTPAAGPQAAPSSTTQPNVYHSEKGFQITYPSGWQVATAEVRTAATEGASKLLANIDFSKVDVLIYDPTTDPTRNLNVVVSPDIVPVNQSSLDDYRNGITQQLSGAGLSPEDIDVKLGKVGSYDAIIATWTADAPSIGRMWQEQFIIPGGSHTFIVTCTSEAGSSPVAGPIFASAMASFKIDQEPTRSISEMWETAPGWVHNALIGAGIGALFGLFGSFKRSMSKPSALPTADPESSAPASDPSSSLPANDPPSSPPTADPPSSPPAG
jgi:hypothetical protein